MKILHRLRTVALILAPIVALALVYFGPIWFLKAEIAEATHLQWKWMVRAYGTPPAMQDCLDDGGGPPNDFYFLWLCAAGWVQPPDPEWQLPPRPECFDLFLAAQNHAISLAVMAQNSENPNDPLRHFKALHAQTVDDLASLTVEDLSSLNLCLQGKPIGGDLTRFRRDP